MPTIPRDQVRPHAHLTKAFLPFAKKVHQTVPAAPPTRRREENVRQVGTRGGKWRTRERLARKKKGKEWDRKVKGESAGEEREGSRKENILNKTQNGSEKWREGRRERKIK